jgi:methanogenic corrinoid protein MtbC1
VNGKSSRYREEYRENDDRGFRAKVYDLGIDIPAEWFVEAVKIHEAQVLALSALLTTTMGYTKGVIDSVAEAGLRDKIRIIVGGAPVTQQFADKDRCKRICTGCYHGRRSREEMGLAI